MISSCYRHPARETGIHCTRCGRSICPDCMVPAAVGHHCPTCVQEGAPATKQVRQVRWTGAGSRAGFGPKTGVVTKALVLVSVLAYFYQSSNFNEVTARFGDVPLLVHQGEYYRLITATFMHANVTHLLLNMLGLWIIGTQVEQVMGGVRFVALYLVAGLGGSVAYNLLGSTNVPAIGASTAVFGLFGAAFVIARARGGEPRTIVTLIVINLVFGFAVPGIDNWGHLGGLVTGAAVAAVFELSERSPSAWRAAVQVLGMGAVLVGLGLALAQAGTRYGGGPVAMGSLLPAMFAMTGGGSPDGKAAGDRVDGAPVWEDSRPTPPVFGDLCRQTRDET